MLRFEAFLILPSRSCSNRLCYYATHTSKEGPHFLAPAIYIVVFVDSEHVRGARAQAIEFPNLEEKVSLRIFFNLTWRSAATLFCQLLGDRNFANTNEVTLGSESGLSFSFIYVYDWWGSRRYLLGEHILPEREVRLPGIHLRQENYQ